MWSSCPCVIINPFILSTFFCKYVISGITKSIPNISSSGNDNPQSTTIISSSYSNTVMFFPTSCNPPNGIIFNFPFLNTLLLFVLDFLGSLFSILFPILFSIFLSLFAVVSSFFSPFSVFSSFAFFVVLVLLVVLAFLVTPVFFLGALVLLSVFLSTFSVFSSIFLSKFSCAISSPLFLFINLFWISLNPFNRLNSSIEKWKHK